MSHRSDNIDEGLRQLREVLIEHDLTLSLKSGSTLIFDLNDPDMAYEIFDLLCFYPDDKMVD